VRLVVNRGVPACASHEHSLEGDMDKSLASLDENTTEAISSEWGENYFISVKYASRPNNINRFFVIESALDTSQWAICDIPRGSVTENDFVDTSISNYKSGIIG
jgi:hypothetical protein